MSSLLKLIFKRRDNVFIFIFVSFFCIYAEGIKVDTLRSDSLLKTFNIKGKIVAGLSWHDKIGKHYVIISEYSQKELCETGFKSELYGIQYTQNDTGVVNDWKIKDFGSNECEQVNYIKNSLKIVDVENSGIGSSRFLYEFSHDCCDPVKVKYLLHVVNVKCAIRGQVPMESGSISQYQKNMDKLFESAPVNIKTFASEDWDDFVKSHFDISQKK